MTDKKHELHTYTSADTEYTSRAQNLLQVLYTMIVKNGVYASSSFGFQTIILTKAV